MVFKWEILLIAIFAMVGVAQNCDISGLRSCVQNIMEEGGSLCSSNYNDKMSGCYTQNGCTDAGFRAEVERNINHVKGICFTWNTCGEYMTCISDVLNINFEKVMFGDAEEAAKVTNLATNFCDHREQYNFGKWSRECITAMESCMTGLMKSLNISIEQASPGNSITKLIDQSDETTIRTMFDQYCGDECKDIEQKSKQLASCTDWNELSKTINQQVSAGQNVGTQCGTLDTFFDCMENAAGECGPLLDTVSHQSATMSIADPMYNLTTAAQACSLKVPRASYQGSNAALELGLTCISWLFLLAMVTYCLPYSLS